MLINNRITQPGGIRRVDLMPDIIHIETSDGKDRLYKLASVADVLPFKPSRSNKELDDVKSMREV